MTGLPSSSHASLHWRAPLPVRPSGGAFWFDPNGRFVSQPRRTRATPVQFSPVQRAQTRHSCPVNLTTGARLFLRHSESTSRFSPPLQSCFDQLAHSRAPRDAEFVGVSVQITSNSSGHSARNRNVGALERSGTTNCLILRRPRHSDPNEAAEHYFGYESYGAQFCCRDTLNCVEMTI